MKSYEKLGCEDLNIAFPEATVEIASEQNLLLFFATNPHYEAMIQAVMFTSSASLLHLSLFCFFFFVIILSFFSFFFQQIFLMFII
tara:strand:- start:523 stop:780 length:258 start_codon:yes stop_codon:yes gene_type:complete